MKYKSLIFFCLIYIASFNLMASIVRYQHTDMLGSVISESDESGNITSRSQYEPFGKRMGGDKDGIGYTGHQHDKDLGLTYMQARYYDPLIGRFYANDPVGFRDVHSFNRYAYANNNPYKYVDPDGNDVVFAVTPNAAGGNGHTSLYFQDGKGDWNAFNQGAAGETASGGNLGFLIGQDASAGVSIQQISADSVPTDGLRISTTSEQDAQISSSAESSMSAHNSGEVKYNIYSNNCTDAAVNVVNNSGAGISVSNPATTVKPNSWIKEVKENPDSVIMGKNEEN
ncbi:RHS repeat-associated core domain-containing protein [Shewanella sp. S23-S33]|uniref:RHS repeat-associated core domain-containing protein n=1 Tax=Shewanella sp. S23-S33 TaxID=3342769 RepID=UPI00372D779E